MTQGTLRERFQGHLESGTLFGEPGVALLAVSGGADSLALLDLMHDVAPRFRLQLLVVHADHGIHPRSRDIAHRVANVARARYGIDTRTLELALGADATETAAREARYAFFRRVQAELGAPYLVTAHHSDDQVETVLLRVLRGSAPAGLAGIPARGPGGLVRPLLPFRRAELAAHVRAAGLEPFEDPANADPRHTRSWVRSALLPLLTDRFGDAAREHLLAVARHAEEEIAAWDAALDALPALGVHAGPGHTDVARAGLAAYDTPLAGRLLRAAARRAGIMLGPSQARRVIAFAPEAASGRILELGDGIVAEVAFDRLVLCRAAVPPEPCLLSGETGTQTFGDFAINWRPDAAPAHLERGGWTTWIEPGALAVRLPAPGSRVVPLRGTGHRKVTRLLMEERIPRGERPRWPLVTRDGEPVWIPGVCRADAAIPAAGTAAVRVDVAAR